MRVRHDLGGPSVENTSSHFEAVLLSSALFGLWAVHDLRNGGRYAKGGVFGGECRLDFLNYAAISIS